MSPARRAAFIAVGSELLRSARVDHNSFTMARLLAPCGVTFVEKRVVEDDETAIATAVAELRRRVDLVVLSGGLGPTADDVTRQGVARALGRQIHRAADLEAMLTKRYLRFSRPMPAIAAQMADVIDGAEVLRNPKGTAPGQLIEADGASIVLMPGVPSELEEITTIHLVPRLGLAPGMATRTLHLGGVYESYVEGRIRGLYDRFGRDTVTILAGRGVVHLVLAAEGDDASGRLEEMDETFAAVAGPDLFGRDEDTLESVVLGMLRSKSWRVATAESCTGGMIGARITSVPGSSEVFIGGIIAYANEVKESALAVSHDVLLAHGAVSREVAEAMAGGACRLGAECGLAVTGIAGPSGGSVEKPIGTVHIAVESPGGRRHVGYRFPGGREQIRELSATFALDLLRRVLEGVPCASL